MQNNYQSEYIIQKEPDGKTLSYNWQTAVGLQKVDGLTPSSYLIQTANDNIAGKISLQEAHIRISEYYKQQPAPEIENRTEEADKVSLRIVEVLSQNTFNMSAIELLSIHKHLFDDIYPFAGKFRSQVLPAKPVAWQDWEPLKAVETHAPPKGGNL